MSLYIRALRQTKGLKTRACSIISSGRGEIVTRIILDAIGFEGQYQSWLHRTAYLSFPGCRLMTDVAAEQAAAAANP